MTTPLRLYVDGPVSAALALGRAEALWQAADEGKPAALYVAPLSDSALLLGRQQRPVSALSTMADAIPRLHRQTGGVALSVGPGVTYCALSLADQGALMACPRGRILNRNVRGLLQGMRRLGVPAHYFGRDWLSLTDARPGAYLAWAQDPTGRTLVECYLSVERSFALPSDLSGYPQAPEPAFRGKQPITLREAGAESLDPATIARALGEGHELAFGCLTQPHPLDTAVTSLERPQADPETQNGPTLHWSDPLPEAIGFVQAGVGLDAAGLLHALGLRGDFMAAHGARSALDKELLGKAPSVERIGRALDLVYGPRGFVMEGIRTLDTLRQAILQAVERAHTARA